MSDPIEEPATLTTSEACKFLGVTRETLRTMEDRGFLSRVGTVATLGARGILYARSDVEAAPARMDQWRKDRRPAPVPSSPPPRVEIPPDMMTATEACAALDITNGALKEWQRQGRLTPASRVEINGRQVRLFRRADVESVALARDRFSPMQRVSAVSDALRGGVPIAEALDMCGVSPTTWNYWVRTRRDAAAAAAADRPTRMAPTPESRTRGPSVIGKVYFVTGTGPRDAVKIGWTVCDPANRLRALQTGSPVELRYLALVRAHSPFEGWCHRQFEPDRKYGEWFARTHRLSRFVSRMAEIGDVTTLTPGELLALLNVEPLSLFGGNHGPTP